MTQTRQLLLASTSPYRRALLERLGLPFAVFAPRVDESALPGESPAQTALRLAQLKARAARPAHPEALIIGSDQVAALGNDRLDKPGSHENAVLQLQRVSGRAADFYTAVALLDAKADRMESRLVRCTVTFRRLDGQRIEAYLRREQPYDCAGSAKAEGLGIALIARIESEDPTSLIGLPLIALTDMLEQAGMPVL